MSLSDGRTPSIHRRHRIKVGHVMSDWAVMEAGMPQRSYLGPLTVVTLIKKQHASCVTHKFVDDITLTEIVAKFEPHASQLRRTGSASERGPDERQWPQNEGDANRHDNDRSTAVSVALWCSG